MALNPQARLEGRGGRLVHGQGASRLLTGPREPPRGGRRRVRPGPGPTGQRGGPGPSQGTFIQKSFGFDSPRFLASGCLCSVHGRSNFLFSEPTGWREPHTSPPFVASPFMGHVASLRRAPEAAPSPRTRDPPSHVGAPVAGPGLTGRPCSGPQLAPVLGDALPRPTAAEPRTLAPG